MIVKNRHSVVVNIIRVSVENPVVIVDFSPGVGSGNVGWKVRDGGIGDFMGS